jgi:hypothetical protein
MTGFQQAKCFKESIIVLERERRRGGRQRKGQDKVV